MLNHATVIPFRGSRFSHSVTPPHCTTKHGPHTRAPSFTLSDLLEGVSQVRLLETSLSRLPGEIETVAGKKKRRDSILSNHTTKLK